MLEGRKEVILGRDFTGDHHYIESPHRKGSYLQGDELPEFLRREEVSGAQVIYDEGDEHIGYLVDYSNEQGRVVQTYFEPADTDIWIRDWTFEWEILNKITEEDKKYYELLDRFGNLGFQFFQSLSDKNIPNDLSADSFETSNFDCNINNGTEDLTEMQRAFLRAFQESLISAQKELEELLAGKNKTDICVELEESFKFGDKGTLRPEEISIVMVPGAMGILLHNRKRFETLFPYAEQTAGLYHKKRFLADGHKDKYIGRVFFVDATGKRVRETFQHEYLHQLTENHIEPYELPSRMSPKEKRMKQDADELRDKIRKLEEEMEFMDGQEFLAAQRQKERMKVQLFKLEKDILEELDQSPKLATEEARRLFLDMRDELAAYILSDRLVTEERALLPRNVTWEDRLQAIMHEVDKEKIKNQWYNLKSIIIGLEHRRISKENLFAIFVTSQDFETMAKRLVLLSGQQSKREATIM